VGLRGTGPRREASHVLHGRLVYDFLRARNRFLLGGFGGMLVGWYRRIPHGFEERRVTDYTPSGVENTRRPTRRELQEDRTRANWYQIVGAIAKEREAQG